MMMKTGLMLGQGRSHLVPHLVHHLVYHLVSLQVSLRLLIYNEICVN